ncbi:MAG: hypothetical protein HYW02_03085 [Deltaproteobacteria bacterium]|nr:hypothetical protein [Deltaproteobacteria bacterium]
MGSEKISARNDRSIEEETRLADRQQPHFFAGLDIGVGETFLPSGRSGNNINPKASLNNTLRWGVSGIADPDQFLSGEGALHLLVRTTDGGALHRQAKINEVGGDLELGGRLRLLDSRRVSLSVFGGMLAEWGVNFGDRVDDEAMPEKRYGGIARLILGFNDYYGIPKWNVSLATSGGSYLLGSDAYGPAGRFYSYFLGFERRYQ